MTQQQVAELVNMHRSNYSKVESGQRELSVAALNNIARYFNMTLDEAGEHGGTHPSRK